MSSERVGLEQRRRRSRAEAEQLVSDYEASGLTRQAFCSGHGLSVAALDKYRRSRRSGCGRMVAVEVVPGVRSTAHGEAEAGSALLVELANGRRISVDGGFEASTLQRLITVLEQV